ncbi:replication protein, partial [Candidatus Poribacteria bacterium]
MAYPEPYQEPYTKYPNRYSDVIKPRLTGVQRDICDIVIRMTYGWHKTTAEISNTVFARKANKSKQGIIKAKKQLEEIGILIVLGKGGGSRTNEYMLDMWYDNPDKSVKASIIRQEEQLLKMENPPSQEEQEDIPEILETPAIDGPTIFEKPEVEMETPSMKIESSTEQEENPPYEENVLESQPETEENPNCDIQESQVIESANHAPEEPSSEQEISDTESAKNPSSIEDSGPLTSKLSLPPYKEGLSINIKERKQTGEPQEKKKAAATVRYKFFSLFPEA